MSKTGSPISIPDQKNLRLTVLASPGQIELHLTAFSRPHAAEAQRAVERLARTISGPARGQCLLHLGRRPGKLSEGFLRDQKKTLATAESCTAVCSPNALRISREARNIFSKDSSPTAIGRKTRLGVSLWGSFTYGAVSPESPKLWPPECPEITGADLAWPSPESPALRAARRKNPRPGLCGSCQERRRRGPKKYFLGSAKQVKFQSSQKALDMLRRYLLERKPSMRTFIAIDLEPSLKQNLCDLLRRLKKLNDRSVSWVRESGMHLTLKFLGEIDEDQAVNIAEILKNVCSISSSFPLSLRGTGFFPANARNPRVLWIGIIEEPALMNLQACLESELERLGFPKEERPFHPHLTIGRIKSSLQSGRGHGRAGQTKRRGFWRHDRQKNHFF